MLKYIRVTCGGALTVQQLFRLLNNMEHSECVFVDQTLDFKEWMQPNIYPEFRNHTDPLQFSYVNGVLYARPMSSDDWDEIGDSLTGHPDPAGPEFSMPYATVPKPTSGTPEARAKVMESASRQAAAKESIARSSAKSLGKWYENKLSPAVLAHFGFDSVDAVLADQKWYTDAIPAFTDRGMATFKLPFPPPWLDTLRQIRTDQAKGGSRAPPPSVVPGAHIDPPRLAAAKMSATASASHVLSHTNIPIVGSTSTGRAAGDSVNGASPIVDSGWYLVYHTQEPKLHLCQVLNTNGRADLTGGLLADVADDHPMLTSHAIVTAGGFQISTVPPWCTRISSPSLACIAH